MIFRLKSSVAISAIFLIDCISTLSSYELISFPFASRVRSPSKKLLDILRFSPTSPGAYIITDPCSKAILKLLLPLLAREITGFEIT